MTLDTTALAARAAAGDTLATEQLLAAVWPDAYRLAWTMLADQSAAQDVAQEACARLLRSITTLRSPQTFRTWFYRIVVNESNRRLRRIATLDAPLEEHLHAANTSQDRTEDRIDLREALRSLDPALRLIVILHYYFGLNCREIAQAAGISAATARWRLMMARRRLRVLLEGDPQSDNLPGAQNGEYARESTR
jgi:RNA polymerase sigma-70 factor (ECF subfamily)